MSLCHAIFTGLWLVNLWVRSFVVPQPQPGTCLTLLFPRLVDWSYRDVDHLHDHTSQVPGLKVSPLPSIGIRSHWLVRCSALDPWTQYIRHVADDKKGVSLFYGKSRLPSIWDCLLCSESPNFAHIRENDTNTDGSERPGFPKVDFLANSTYGAPIRSFTSWSYAPPWCS